MQGCTAPQQQQQQPLLLRSTRQAPGPSQQELQRGGAAIHVVPQRPGEAASPRARRAGAPAPLTCSMPVRSSRAWSRLPEAGKAGSSACASRARAESSRPSVAVASVLAE